MWLDAMRSVSLEEIDFGWAGDRDQTKTVDSGWTSTLKTQSYLVQVYKEINFEYHRSDFCFKLPTLLVRFFRDLERDLNRYLSKTLVAVFCQNCGQLLDINTENTKLPCSSVQRNQFWVSSERLLPSNCQYYSCIFCDFEKDLNRYPRKTFGWYFLLDTERIKTSGCYMR